jgi:hypothetical protein
MSDSPHDQIIVDIYPRIPAGYGPRGSPWADGAVLAVKLLRRRFLACRLGKIDRCCRCCCYHWDWRDQSRRGSELDHRLNGKTAGIDRLFAFAILPFPAGYGLRSRLRLGESHQVSHQSRGEMRVDHRGHLPADPGGQMSTITGAPGRAVTGGDSFPPVRSGPGRRLDEEAARSARVFRFGTIRFPAGCAPRERAGSFRRRYQREP